MSDAAYTGDVVLRHFDVIVVVMRDALRHAQQPREHRHNECGQQ